jgi:predicted phosphodiesterase
LDFRTLKHFYPFIFIGVISICIASAADEAEPVFRFGVAADAQYCDINRRGTRYYRASLTKLQECVTDFNLRDDLTFVIHLGDFIERRFASFDQLLPVYQQLKMPAYQVLGNHDFYVAGADKGKVPQKLGLEKPYYDFAYYSWRFVVLDGNDLSLYAHLKGSAKYKAAEAMFQSLKAKEASNAYDWNGGIGAEQIAWLKQTLENAEQAGETVIVFCHFPVFPKHSHNLWNDTELIDAIEPYKCVVAYINGHNHQGHYGQKNGIHYLTVHGMVETPDQNAYAVFEVYKDRLNVIGYGREPSRVLHIQQSD